MKKQKLVYLPFFLILVLFLSGCETEVAPMIIESKTSTTNTIINNITQAGSNVTNNITNNITNNYTISNTSYSCNDANDYLYNVSILNGQLTGICAADSTGGGGDTGGWTNTTTQTRTALEVNITNSLIIKNISFQNTSNSILNGLYMNPTGSAINVIGQLYANTILSSGTALYTDGDLYTRGSGGDIWLGASSQSNANVSLTPSSIQLRGSAGGINTTYLTVQNLNTGASCDLKAYTNGTVYCGTDSGGSASDYSILSDAQYNLTNKIGLQNSTLLACQNITGAVSNLCTITSGGGSSSQIGLPNRGSNYMVYSTEFMSRAQVSAQDPFTMGAISSGTTAARNGNATHPGVVGFLTSTTASSGYYVATDINAFLLNGSESYSAVLSVPSKTGNVSITYAGYIDVITAAASTDGVYFNITNVTVRCEQRNNGAPTLSQTNYNLTLNAWYVFSIDINSTVGVNCTIKDGETGVSLVSWNMTNPSTFPRLVGRETGAGITSAVRGGTTAQNIVNIDYLEIGLNKTLYR